MGGDEDGQSKLPMDLPEPTRPRRRRARPARRRGRDEAPRLMPAPVVQACGFCGNRQTLLAEAGICEKCGGILVRDSESME